MPTDRRHVFKYLRLSLIFSFLNHSKTFNNKKVVKVRYRKPLEISPGRKTEKTVYYVSFRVDK